MRLTTAVFLTLVAGLVAAGSPVSAQHATAFDIEDGGRVFQTSCATCHGPDGDQVAGIDLGRGQFRRTLSDEELARIITNGIPNTPMPATRMSEVQAARVVAYLRSTASSASAVSATGDVARGKAVFENQGACLSCHRAEGRGSRLGPDLSAIGRVRRTVELEQSVLDPGADVQPTNRFYGVVTADGRRVTGRLLNHDTYTVQILDADERLRSFVKAELREHGFIASPMPSYRDRLDAQAVADVVSYLVSLKGPATP